MKHSGPTDISSELQASLDNLKSLFLPDKNPYTSMCKFGEQMPEFLDLLVNEVVNNGN